MSLDPTTGSDLSNGRATVLSRRFDHAHYGSVSSAVVGSALTEPLEDDYGVRSSIGPALEHLVDFNSGFTAGDRTEFTFWPGDGVSLTSDAVRDELEGERPGEASMPVAVLESVIAESVTAPLPNAWSAELSLPAASIVPTNDEALFTVAQDSGSSLQAATAELGFSGMLPTPDRSLPEQDSSLAAGLGQSVVPSPEPSGFLLLVIGSSAMFVFQRLRKRASPASQTSMA
jgi:hypothetical protein